MDYEILTENEMTRVARYRVPGGWIYETSYKASDNGHLGISTTFVPEFIPSKPQLAPEIALKARVRKRHAAILRRIAIRNKK